MVLQKGESFSPRVMAGMELTSFAPSFSARPDTSMEHSMALLYQNPDKYVKDITMTHIN